MKRIVSIATKGDRPEQLKRTIDSLANQCDELFVYDNSKSTDYTDNAKFFRLSQLTETCYYFTCDDDIIYPEDYIQHIVYLIYKYGTIITFHGRNLRQPVKRYYQGHDIYDFRHTQDKPLFVDVAGTGVCGFSTQYFNPTELYKSEYKCMSDLVFSLEAKRQGQKIICGARQAGWLKQQEVSSGILQAFAGKDESKQIELAKLIIE